ncbi:DODA-type extradiol aromatic ring-opening family dioxygenase [Bacillus aquiflavi]|nr:class III extradiol ring-cleavage dioxygenase [Bacillus aquiflavi]
MPALFVSHGAPTLAIENNEYTKCLQELGKSYPKPKAIVVFSAHWESSILSVSVTDEIYETIYDFMGFPAELYQIDYRARGDKQIAEKIIGLFGENGLQVRGNKTRGLDHGVWVILKHMYPEADIPVINISVSPNLQPKEQYLIGHALQQLREDNVLIIGSGGITHNLREIGWGETEPYQWSFEFDSWVIDQVLKWDTKSLFNYEEEAPHAKRAVPRNEHFIPLFMAMGSADNMKKASIIYRGYRYGSLSMIVFKFH